MAVSKFGNLVDEQVEFKSIEIDFSLKYLRARFSRKTAYCSVLPVEVLKKVKKKPDFFIAISGVSIILFRC